MKVFISWSGQRSKAMAGALKEWLPLILQYAQPWVSDKDIGAGDRWAQAIAGELESSNFGILCITPENLNSEWILFEAGALSKSMQDAKVIPLLFGLELSDLSGPLSQFQAIKVDEQGMLDVAKSINEVSENKAAEATIEQLVPALWPQLEGKLSEIPKKGAAEKHMRPQTEILEDLVSQVRGLGSRMREVDSELAERASRTPMPRFSSVHPDVLSELLHRGSEYFGPGGNYPLVMAAGYIRGRMPWMAEVLIEAHREMSNASPKQLHETASQLHEFVEFSLHGPMSEKLVASTKYRSGLAQALHEAIERAVEACKRKKEALTADLLN
nr:toll/interleukin-1 receptor domain-containing protein [Ruegeria arenilitoris]